MSATTKTYENTQQKQPAKCSSTYTELPRYLWLYFGFSQSCYFAMCIIWQNWQGGCLFATTLFIVFQVPCVSRGAYNSRPTRPCGRLDVSLQRGCYPHQKAGINVLRMILDGRSLVSCRLPTSLFRTFWVMISGKFFSQNWWFGHGQNWSSGDYGFWIANGNHHEFMNFMRGFESCPWSSFVDTFANLQIHFARGANGVPSSCNVGGTMIACGKVGQTRRLLELKAVWRINFWGK